MEENNNLIQSENLNLFYGEKQALKNINLTFSKKTVTALIGPSGCGKSTFLRCINRMNDLILNTRIEGKLFIKSKNIYSKNTNIVELRKNVGMVFQNPTPFPFSIYDNIAYGPRIWGVKKKDVLNDIVERSLKLAALWDDVKDDLKKNAMSLSGGQQQRLSIARALAVEPKVLLMDEPTSALDPLSTKKIEELILTLKEKYTIIIVTHNMQQAARISDHTALFYMGEMIEHDITSNIFTNPSKKLTEEYITGRFG